MNERPNRSKSTSFNAGQQSIPASSPFKQKLSPAYERNGIFRLTHSRSLKRTRDLWTEITKQSVTMVSFYGCYRSHGSSSFLVKPTERRSSLRFRGCPCHKLAGKRKSPPTRGNRLPQREHVSSGVSKIALSKRVNSRPFLFRFPLVAPSKFAPRETAPRFMARPENCRVTFRQNGNRNSANSYFIACGVPVGSRLASENQRRR